jgi:hypothetical protein
MQALRMRRTRPLPARQNSERKTAADQERQDSTACHATPVAQFGLTARPTEQLIKLVNSRRASDIACLICKELVQTIIGSAGMTFHAFNA